MPTYQYRCRDCGHGFEQFQKFSEDPLTVCPACEGYVQRVIQNVGVVFKGSGWYINDSRTPAKGTANSDDAPAAKKDTADSAAKPDSAKTKSKDSATSEPKGSKSAEPAAAAS